VSKLGFLIGFDIKETGNLMKDKFPKGFVVKAQRPDSGDDNLDPDPAFRFIQNRL
jgi:hypothetical protein